MRVPISYALTYPERAPPRAAAQLDLSRPLSLTFEPPDTDTFRCLALARAAGEAGGTAPCVLNAANEEAVAAFLAGRSASSTSRALVADALDARRRSAPRRPASTTSRERRRGAPRAPPSPTALAERVA